MRLKLILIGALIALVFGVLYVGTNVPPVLQGLLPLLRSPAGDLEDLSEGGEHPLFTPPGFSISIFAEGLVNPRDLIRGPDGTLMVSVPSEGTVLALPDFDGNGVADEVRVVASGLDRPHGLATSCYPVGVEGFEYDCDLFIAETHGVSRFRYDRERMQALSPEKILELPAGGNHFTRSLVIAPVSGQDTLLVSVGSTCNVCNESDERRAAVLAVSPDGGTPRIFARGLRNTVFMTIHPVTGAVWGTDMGRDLLGDDLPPDEINILEEGKNYGWPICFGKNIHDTDFDKNTYVRNPCMEPFETPSHIDIPPHSAPLGLAFVPEEGWPESHWFDLFVAYHGSWNRSTPTGYKVVRVLLDEKGNLEGIEDFITGWFTSDGEVLGRPADILIESGGRMFISDDRAGVVYQVRYRGEQ